MEDRSVTAKRLRPAMIKEIEDMLLRRGTEGGGGGGTVIVGAPSPHALSGTHHSGVLLDEQAPQFLLLDGTRALIGNLSVDPAITIDGVDISAHAADPDAHHNRVTVGNTGLSLSTQELSLNLNATSGLEISSGLRIADSIAGSGLTIASKVLAVGAGNGIAVAADAVAVDLAADSGLTFSGGDLTMGAPTGIGVNTNNQVSGTGHTHAVSAESDVGTTPSAAILKSTSQGGLILGNLGVKGNVDITNGGDLTVGANIFFVDASQAIVGINRVPDPQFSLDVAGALRADFLVGKHAIQLEEALLIAHFDGRGPYNTNTVGDLHGHAGQPPITSGDVLVREGMFNSAVEIAGAYTNDVANPEFASGATTGYTDHATGTAAGTRATTQEDAFAGSYSYKIAKTGGANGDGFGTDRSFSATSGTTYTASAWVKVLAIDTSGNSEGQLQIGLVGAAFSDTYATYSFSEDPDEVEAGTHYPVNEWIRLTVQNAATSTNPGSMRFRISGATTATFLLSAVQRLGNAIDRPYFNGTRTAGSLRYAGIPVNWRRMTWMAWIYPHETAAGTGNNNYVGNLYVSAGHQYQLYINGTAEKLRFTVSGNVVCESTTAIPVDEWTHVAVTVSGTTARLYINGALEDTETIAALPVGTPDVYVGDIQAGGQRINGYIDEFVLTNKVEPTSRILSIYESDAPVFAESSVFHFSATPTQLVWADDEGLWMKDVDGNAVVGFYGGAAATKSWGGFTLAKGDIAFGRYGTTDGGWLLFDRDGVSSKPYLTLGTADDTIIEFDANGARIAGSLALTGEVNIATGALVLDPDGLTMRSGTGDINRIDWIAPSDAGHMASIRTEGNTLGGPSDLYIIAGGVGPAQQGVGQGRLGTILLGAYSDANTDTGPQLVLNYGTGITLYGTNSGTPPSLTVTTTGFSFLNGTILTNLTLADTKYVAADIFRARDSGGLSLEDDGGNVGLFVEDGGQVGVGVAAPGVRLDVSDSSGPVVRVTRSEATPTQGLRNTINVKAKRTDAATDGYGSQIQFYLEDDGAVENVLGAVGASRNGADDSGMLELRTTSAGTLGTKMRITAGGLVGINSDSSPDAQLEVVSGDNARVAGIFNSASSPTEDIFRVLRNGAAQFAITKDGDVTLVDTAASGVGVTGPILQLQTLKATASAQYDMCGTIRFRAHNDAGTPEDIIYVDLYGQVDDDTATAERGAFYIITQHGGGDAMPFAANGANVRMLAGGLSAPTGMFQGSKGVLWLDPVTTAPSAAPASGVFLWYDGVTDQIKYRKPGGAATVLV